MKINLMHVQNSICFATFQSFCYYFVLKITQFITMFYSIASFDSWAFEITVKRYGNSLALHRRMLVYRCPLFIFKLHVSFLSPWSTSSSISLWKFCYKYTLPILIFSLFFLFSWKETYNREYSDLLNHNNLEYSLCICVPVVQCSHVQIAAGVRFSHIIYTLKM